MTTFQHGRCPSRPASSGLTIIELLTAVAVVSILMPLIFAVYLNLSKSFLRQTEQANSIEQMLATKLQIDRAIDEMETIVSVTENQIALRTDFDDTVRVLQFDKSALRQGQQVISRNLKSFSCELAYLPDSSKGVLTWAAEIDKGGWVGGAGLKKISAPK